MKLFNVSEGKLISLLILSSLLAACNTVPNRYQNYDYNSPTAGKDLSMPASKSHAFYKFYRDYKSNAVKNAPFVKKTMEDELSSVVSHDIRRLKGVEEISLIGTKQSFAVLNDFPKLDPKKNIFRFETEFGLCRLYDCTNDAVDRKTSRAEISIGEHKLGRRVNYRYSFYIPKEVTMDGTDRVHITQVKGGSEEIPSWIGVAPKQREPKAEDRRHIVEERIIDENGIEITQQTARYSNSNKNWVFNQWGGGTRQVNADIETGDLVVHFRSILGLKDHVSNYMFKLADKDEFKGKWHSVEYDITWSRNPREGALKMSFNGKEIVNCNPCQTAPNHQFSDNSNEYSRKYRLKIGAYRWINGNSREGSYFYEPNDIIVYYKDIEINKM
jgi:hypothetical protein